MVYERYYVPDDHTVIREHPSGAVLRVVREDHEQTVSIELASGTHVHQGLRVDAEDIADVIAAFQTHAFSAAEMLDPTERRGATDA
jgi:hypothetical protein